MTIEKEHKDLGCGVVRWMQGKCNEMILFYHLAEIFNTLNPI